MSGVGSGVCYCDIYVITSGVIVDIYVITSGVGSGVVSYCVIVYIYVITWGLVW